MRVSVRAASKEDLDPLVDLARSCLGAARSTRGGSRYLANELRIEPSFLAEALSSRLGSPEHLVGIGELDGVPLGLVLAEMTGGADDLRAVRVEVVWVDPGAREVGLGADLLAQVEAWALSRGAVGIDVPVLPGLREGKNLLESAGYIARLIVMNRSLPSDPVGGEGVLGA
ncbi:MAG: GNAT family N-acetyltransferase [Acidimicrobiales bacterium]